MSTIKYILEKYNLRVNDPIEIPNVGRDDLAMWLHELDFKIGVEVGVAAGEYSEVLCSKNPQMKLYGVDPWAPYRGYRDYTKDSTFSRLYKSALEKAQLFTNLELVREFSPGAASMFEDESLDFVYIDANHQEPYVSQDIQAWAPKVKPGGILAGHDYIRLRGKDGAEVDCGVKDAVQKYTKENNIATWFVLGLSAKIPGVIRDVSRSWMIIK